LLTVILGAAFLLMQAREYHDKLRVLGPTDNAYGSLFYTITGLHGTHVAFGLLVLLWTLMRDVRGTIAAPQARSPAIRNASLYWHFVDGVWIAVFTTLYLTPRWS
jgi:heme/copper-type cytochrome/quinol oxidase subunit 3